MNADEAIDYMLKYEENNRKNTPRWNERESFMHKVNRKRGVVYFCFLLLFCILGSALTVAFGSGINA